MKTEIVERVFFDTASSGHHAEFFENIIKFLDTKNSKKSIIIANPILERRLIEFRNNNNSLIKLLFITTDQVEFIKSAHGRVQSGFRELKVINTYLEIYKPKHLVFLNLGVQMIPLYFYRFKHQISISGIYLNYPSFTDRTTSLRTKRKILIRKLRQIINIYLMLCNKSVKKVFILNDKRIVTFLNSIFRNDKFEKITDPYPARSLVYDISKQKGSSFSFLLIGQIEKRKGVLDFLEALERIENMPKKIKVFLMGPCSSDLSYGKRVIEKIKILSSLNISIESSECFVDYKTLNEKLYHCDCVVALYKGHLASSGMIGHACRYNKPLLVSKEGFLGEYVNQKKLGISVDPSHREELSISIIKMINGDFSYNHKSASDYTTDSSPEVFVRKLNRSSFE